MHIRGEVLIVLQAGLNNRALNVLVPGTVRYLKEEALAIATAISILEISFTS